MESAKAELLDTLHVLQRALLADAMCKEKGGLTAASRERCMALLRDAIAQAGNLK